MSTITMDSMLVFRNKGMLWKNTLFALLINLIIFSSIMSPKAGFYTPFLVLLFVLQTAHTLSFAHKELLNGAFSWNTPGMLSRFFRAQLLWMTITMLESVVYLAVLQMINSNAFASWENVHLLSFGCFAGVLYILTVMVVLRFEYSAMVIYAPILVMIFLPRVYLARNTNLLSLMNEWWVFVLALILMIFGLRKMMLSKSMHRKICDRPLLTPDIVLNTTKMQSYKAGKDKKLVSGSFAQRPGGLLMATLLGKVAEAKAQGLNCNSRIYAGLLIYLTLFPRSRWGNYLYMLAIPVLIILSGYYASYTDLSMDRWFSSISFLVFGYIPGMMGYSLVDQPVVLISRKTRERAGFKMATWLGIFSLVVPSAAWFLLKFMESSLPKFSAGSREISYLAPNPEMMFSALFVLSVILLVVARFKPSQNKLQMISVLAFYFFAAGTAIPRSVVQGGLPLAASVILLGIFLAAMVLFFVFWRKSCRQWDQG